jgi:hypothetical protein
MKEQAKLLKTGGVIIDVRKDQQWFEKAKDEMAKLCPLHLRGANKEQITKLYQCPEFLRYERAMRAKAGEWKTEGMLTIEPPIES